MTEGESGARVGMLSEGDASMGREGIVKRMARLQELALEMMREAAWAKDGENALWRVERLAVAEAMRLAVDGVERARLVLAGVAARSGWFGEAA